jgi:1-acyl-sn-glycerol-3-phosphate acyltransferase
MGRIVRNLFGIYALIVFALSFFVVLPCYFLVFLLAGKENAPRLAHRGISRRWAAVLFFLFGIRLNVRNRERLDPASTYVFVANHRSLLDIPSYAIACQNTFRFLSKEELTKIPGMGWVIRKLYITVDRKDKAARLRSMDRMVQSLRDGVSVFLCPEGTRNKTNRPLLDFHDGAFRVAIEAQVPLAVMTIIHSDRLLSPLHPIALMPGRIECIWEHPIETIGMTAQDVPRLRETVKKLMLKHLEEVAHLS